MGIPIWIDWLKYLLDIDIKYCLPEKSRPEEIILKCTNSKQFNEGLFLLVLVPTKKYELLFIHLSMVSDRLWIWLPTMLYFILFSLCLPIYQTESQLIKFFLLFWLSYYPLYLMYSNKDCSHPKTYSQNNERWYYLGWLCACFLRFENVVTSKSCYQKYPENSNRL